MSIPISKLQAQFHLNREGLERQLRLQNPKLVYQEIYDIKVDFKEYTIQFPTMGAIEADFSEGVIFTFNKSKDKDKSLKLLDTSFHAFLKK